MMVQPIVINACNISKSYRRYAHPVDRFKELIFPNAVKGEEFWALRDVSLQVKKGESVGILGQNGSGKSTLLQIITGTLAPSLGTVQVGGRVSALLELGSGFNPDFTGRENVMINGRILGFSKKEIESKLEEIIDFADIGDFIEQPVHTYSSGMFVRLAFAAAVVWEPEILIIDEALAVGDIFFQQKCFTRIKALQESGTTILFVSHNTQSVLNLCHRAAVLDHGEVIYFGDASVAVERYYESYYMEHQSEKPLQIDLKFEAELTPQPENNVASDMNLPFMTDLADKSRYGIQTGLIQGVCITDVNGNSKSAVSTQESMVLSIKLGHYPEHLWPLNVGFHLRDRLGQMIIATNTKMLGQDLDDHAPGKGLMCQFRFKPQIAPGEYTLDVAVAENKLDAKKIYDWINNVMSITVSSGVKDREQAGIARPDISVTIT